MGSRRRPHLTAIRITSGTLGRGYTPSILLIPRIPSRHYCTVVLMIPCILRAVIFELLLTTSFSLKRGKRGGLRWWSGELGPGIWNTKVISWWSSIKQRYPKAKMSVSLRRTCTFAIGAHPTRHHNSVQRCLTLFRPNSHKKNIVMYYFW